MKKLNSVNIEFDANDEIKIKVRFKNVDVELRDSGFIFFNSSRVQNHTSFYKLIKENGYILLKSDKDSDSPQKGSKRFQRGKRSNYKFYYPHYITQQIATIERYGSNFRLELEGNDSFKLYPMLIEETKQVTEEIFNTITRCTQENN